MLMGAVRTLYKSLQDILYISPIFKISSWILNMILNMIYEYALKNVAKSLVHKEHNQILVYNLTLSLSLTKIKDILLANKMIK